MTKMIETEKNESPQDERDKLKISRKIASLHLLRKYVLNGEHFIVHTTC